MTPLVLALLAAAPGPPSPGHAGLERARAALVAGDASKAAALAVQAVRAAGDGVTAAVAVHRGAQDLLLSLGKGDELVAYYDRLLRADVADAYRRYLRARVESEPLKRRREIESVFLASPGILWAAYDLADAYAREGNLPRAVEYADRAAALAPGEAAAWNVLGHLRLEYSRDLATAAERVAVAGQARAALERAVELDPRSAEALYNLGLVLYVLDNAAEAKASWTKAVELKPGFAEALNSLGHAAAREGKLDEAIAAYSKAIAARPRYGTAHNNLAVAYLRKGDVERARKHLALAEAAGYEPAESFARVVARETESAAFVAFQKRLAQSRSRELVLTAGAAASAVPVSSADARAIVMGLLDAGFRDSHGGVSVAEHGSAAGGERRVGSTPVARYVAAARLALKLDGGEALELLAVVRESTPSGRRELTTWFADTGRRFSADAPAAARPIAALLGLPLAAGE